MHKSQIFLFALISFAVGVGTRSFWNVPLFLVYSFFALGCFLVVFSFLSRAPIELSAKWKCVILMTGIFFLAGAFGVVRLSWHEISREDATILFYADGGEVAVHGVIQDDPDVREKNTRLVLEVSGVSVNGVSYAARGRVLVFANRYPAFSYGDEIIITGVIQKPELVQDFDYPAYLAKDQIYAVMYYPEITYVSSGNGDILHRVLFQIKHMFEDVLARVVPEPHTAFLKGIILGSRASMPEWLLDTFRMVGVIHIIALSGFNITVIADNLVRVLRWFTLGPKWSFWVSLITIVCFTIMTGASPSIVRAALMGILVLLARKEGRVYVGVNALVFVGVIMMLHNPAILRFDTAFQLSFLATAGLLFLAPSLEKHLWHVPTWLGIRGNLASTLAAQIAVLPLLLWYFGTFSLVSIPVNMLILGIIPYGMLFGFMAGVAGFINTPLGIGIGILAHAVSWYVISVSLFFSHIPIAELHIW